MKTIPAPPFVELARSLSARGREDAVQSMATYLDRLETGRLARVVEHAAGRLLSSSQALALTVAIRAFVFRPAVHPIFDDSPGGTAKQDDEALGSMFKYP